MKKLILFTLFFATTNIYKAQIYKGRQMAGINFNFGSNSSERADTAFNNSKNSNNYFSIGIRYGYFITDRIMVGVNGSVSNGLYKSENNSPNSFSKSTQISQTIFAGIFSRYYKMLGKSKFGLFGQVNLNYGSGSGVNKSSSGYPGTIFEKETTNKTSSLNIGVSPGVTYFLNKNFALESYFGNLGFYTQKTELYEEKFKIQESTNSNVTSYLNLSLSNLYIGINFYFGGKAPEPVKE